jgi:hydrogenase/urease accessory protein HupE
VAPSALGLTARLEGKVPAGAKTIGFFASRAFPPVRLTVAGHGGTPRVVEVLERGGDSRPLPLHEVARPSGASVAGRFLRLGFTHIVPEGLDHMLFVLGLTLLSSRLAALLAQVTAFTLAHTATLGLAVYGVASLPVRVVEPLIAASIVYVAVENLFRREASWARLAVVFGFGLLHGLGFAGALSALGWPAGQRWTALLFFNLGVELGQLVVIGLGLLLLTVASRLGLPRRRLEQAASVAIALAGGVWTIERLL